MRKFLLAAMCLAVAGCASSRPIAVQTVSDADVFSNARDIEVALTNYSFDPDVIRLNSGQPYRLTIVNDASSGHDFAAPDFFEAARLSPSDASVVADGEVEVPSGERRTISLVPAAGEYDLVCTRFGHAALGMTGKIVVE